MHTQNSSRPVYKPRSNVAPPTLRPEGQDLQYNRYRRVGPSGPPIVRAYASTFEGRAEREGRQREANRQYHPSGPQGPQASGSGGSRSQLQGGQSKRSNELQPEEVGGMKRDARSVPFLAGEGGDVGANNGVNPKSAVPQLKSSSIPTPKSSAPLPAKLVGPALQRNLPPPPPPKLKPSALQRDAAGRITFRPTKKPQGISSGKKVIAHTSPNLATTSAPAPYLPKLAPIRPQLAPPRPRPVDAPVSPHALPPLPTSLPLRLPSTSRRVKPQATTSASAVPATYVITLHPLVAPRNTDTWIKSVTIPKSLLVPPGLTNLPTGFTLFSQRIWRQAAELDGDGHPTLMVSHVTQNDILAIRNRATVYSVRVSRPKAHERCMLPNWVLRVTPKEESEISGIPEAKKSRDGQGEKRKGEQTPDTESEETTLSCLSPSELQTRLFDELDQLEDWNKRKENTLPERQEVILEEIERVQALVFAIKAEIKSRGDE